MDENKNDNKKEYEDVCYMCHRPESTAGKMLHLPNNICVCRDCMQKSLDLMSSSNFPMMDMYPGMNFMPNDLPNSQKLKKKAASEEKEAEQPEVVFDYKNAFSFFS